MNHPAASAPLADNCTYALPVPGWACALGLAQAVLFVTVLTLLGLP